MRAIHDGIIQIPAHEQRVLQTLFSAAENIGLPSHPPITPANWLDILEPYSRKKNIHLDTLSKFIKKWPELFEGLLWLNHLLFRTPLPSPPCAVKRVLDEVETIPSRSPAP